MPRAYPEEFRRDVVEIARRNETPIAQIAKDFGISDAVIRRWLAKADVEDGLRPASAAMESAELRKACKRIRLQEMENEVLRRAAVYLGRGINPKWCSLSCAISRSRGSRFRCLAVCWVFPAMGITPVGWTR